MKDSWPVEEAQQQWNRRQAELDSMTIEDISKKLGQIDASIYRLYGERANLARLLARKTIEARRKTEAPNSQKPKHGLVRRRLAEEPEPK